MYHLRRFPPSQAQTASTLSLINFQYCVLSEICISYIYLNVAYPAHSLCKLQAHLSNRLSNTSYISFFVYLLFIFDIFFCISYTVTWLPHQARVIALWGISDPTGLCQSCVGKLRISIPFGDTFSGWNCISFIINLGYGTVEWFASMADRVGFHIYPNICNYKCTYFNVLFWGLLIHMFVLYRDIHTYTNKLWSLLLKKRFYRETGRGWTDPGWLSDPLHGRINIYFFCSFSEILFYVYCIFPYKGYFNNVLF